MTEPVFISDLDRYGRIGHQTSRMMTAFLLAHFYKGYFLATEYKFFPWRANDLLDFSKSQMAFKEGKIIGTNKISNGFRLPHGNDDFDTSKTSGLLRLTQAIDSLLDKNQKSRNGFILISLPFDQAAGKLMNILRKKEVKEDLKRVSQPLREYSIVHKYHNSKKISIHIRRGDVTEDLHPTWWIPDSFYQNLIQNLDELLDKEIEICIYSQEPLSSDIKMLCKDRVKLFLESSKWSNESEAEALIGMYTADIIIGSISSFSLLANKLSGNKFILIANELPASLAFGVDADLIQLLPKYHDKDLPRNLAIIIREMICRL